MMWANVEFKRCFFSLKTVLLVLASICFSALSFYFSYQEKNIFVQMLVEKPVDVDLERAAETVEMHNGIQFDLDFFQSDFYELYIVVLFLFCGIFLSARIRETIESGYMNLLVSRMSYKEYARQMFLAQSLYIFAVVGLSMVIDLVIGYLVGGVGSGFGMIGGHQIGKGLFLLLCAVQIIITCLFLILANGISLYSSFFIEKALLIQCVPFFVFFLLPLLLASTIGNLAHRLGAMLSYFVPYYNLGMFSYSFFQYGFDPLIFLAEVLPYVLYSIVLVFCYKKNVRKFSEDCI